MTPKADTKMTAAEAAEMQKQAEARKALADKRQKLMESDPAARLLGALPMALNQMQQGRHNLGLAPDALAKRFVQGNFGGCATAAERVFAGECFKEGMSSGAIAMANTISLAFLEDYERKLEEHNGDFLGYTIRDIAAIIKNAMTTLAGVNDSKQWASQLDDLISGVASVHPGAQEPSI